MHKDDQNRENEILDRIETDIGAFADLYEFYFDRVFGWCCGILLDRDEARDVAQETLLLLYGKLKQGLRIDRCKGAEGLLRTIARSKCIDLIRKIERKATLHEAEAADRQNLKGSASSYGSDHHETVAECLSELSAEDREILVLHVKDGYTLKECAEVLGVSTACAGNRSLRARERLKAALEKRGIRA